MKLVMTLLVRDEVDIIRQHIAFHLAHGVDHIIAMDNLSVDATPDILGEYERSGRLTYLFQPDDDYAQGRWVTQMARFAATRFGADWVINSDADEFWWPRSGNLKRDLAQVPPDILAVSVPRTNFLPRRAGRGLDFAECMTLREARSLTALGEPLPPKVCHRASPRIEVEQGNHGVSHAGARVDPGRAGIEILHFPVRTYNQFANKIAKGGAAYGRNRDLPYEIGRTWRELHALWLAGSLPRYFDGLLLDERDIAAGLRDGTILVDERLRRALRTCLCPPPLALV